ncbi:MAG: anthranilate synthase component I [Candidatus Dormibacteria bacterium]
MTAPAATISPGLAEVRELAATHNLIAVHRSDLADTETPVAAYWRLNEDRPGFLLESVEGGERLGRYSFIGGEPRASITMRAGQAEIVEGGQVRTEEFSDPITLLSDLMGAYRQAPPTGLPARFSGGLVGYMAYEAARYFERLPAPASDPLEIADAVFFLADDVVVFDHLLHRRTIISHVRLEPGAEVEAAYVAAVERIEAMAARLDSTEAPPGPGYGREKGSAAPTPVPEPEAETWSLPEPETWSLPEDAFKERVLRCKEYILDGDIFQVQVSRRLRVPMSAHPFYLYRVLRTVNPSPYMYYLRLPGHAGERRRGTAIVGTSPEILVRVEDGEVEYRPIAGTRRRGDTPERDAELEAELQASEKERAEHLMLVDLGRNDVGRFARVGSVEVPELFFVERYSAVMHLVSRVTATLAEGATGWDALRACFPAGTVTGAPKIRAMEVIAEMEPEARGVYAGAVGYVGFSGNVDTCIAIRTAVVKDDYAYLQAAGGIVADSSPEEELLETENKLAALRRAVSLAHEARL